MPKVLTEAELQYLRAIAQVKEIRLSATIRSYIGWCLGGYVELPKLMPMLEAMAQNLANLEKAKKPPIFDAGD